MAMLEGMIFELAYEQKKIDSLFSSIASRFVAKYLARILDLVISSNPSEHPLKWLELAYSKLTELFKQKMQETKVEGAKHCGTTGLIV